MERAGSHARVSGCAGWARVPGSEGATAAMARKGELVQRRTRDWGRRARATRSRESRKHQLNLHLRAVVEASAKRGGMVPLLSWGRVMRGKESHRYEFDFGGTRGEVNLGVLREGERSLL